MAIIRSDNGLSKQNSRYGVASRVRSPYPSENPVQQCTSERKKLWLLLVSRIADHKGGSCRAACLRLGWVNLQYRCLVLCTEIVGRHGCYIIGTTYSSCCQYLSEAFPWSCMLQVFPLAHERFYILGLSAMAGRKKRGCCACPCEIHLWARYTFGIYCNTEFTQEPPLCMEPTLWNCSCLQGNFWKSKNSQSVGAWLRQVLFRTDATCGLGPGVNSCHPRFIPNPLSGYVCVITKSCFQHQNFI